MQLRRERVQGDGEVGVVHLGGEHVLERLADAARAVNVPFRIRNEEGREERQTLNVVPMRVRDQDVAAPSAPLLHQRSAERACTGAGVNDERSSRIRHHLDARGVAAITKRGTARRGNGSACSPEAHNHSDMV